MVIPLTVRVIVVKTMRGTPVTVACPDPITMIHPRVVPEVLVDPGVLLPHPVPSVLPPVRRPGRVPLRSHRARRSGRDRLGGKTIRGKAIGGKVIEEKVRSIRSSARLPGRGTRAPHPRPVNGYWVSEYWVSEY